MWWQCLHQTKESTQTERENERKKEREKECVRNQHTNQIASSIQSLSMAAMITPSTWFNINKTQMQCMLLFFGTYLDSLHVKYSNSWICQIGTLKHIIHICTYEYLLLTSKNFNLPFMNTTDIVPYSHSIRFPIQHNCTAIYAIQFGRWPQRTVVNFIGEETK